MTMSILLFVCLFLKKFDGLFRSCKLCVAGCVPFGGYFYLKLIGLCF